MSRYKPERSCSRTECPNRGMTKSYNNHRGVCTAQISLRSAAKVNKIKNLCSLSVGLVFLGGLKSGNPIPPIQEDWVSSSASAVFGGLWSTFPFPLMPCSSPSSFCNRSASLSTGFRSKLTAGVCRCLITEFVVFCVYHSLIAAVFVVYHRFGRVFVSNVLRVLMFNNY